MRTCIATLFNSKYIEPAAVLIQSLSDNYHGHEECDIVCITPAEDVLLVDDLKARLTLKQELNLVSVSLDDVKSSEIESKEVEHWAGSTLPFYKLFLGSLLSDYDKVIFLDADILIVRDIKPLLEYPMNRPFLAVPDLSEPERAGMEDWVIFNTGVFISDLGWWRSSGIERVFIDHLETNDATFFLDEDIFNQYLRHVWEPISPIYNFFKFEEDDYGISNRDVPLFKKYFEKAIVVHFAGGDKPWNSKELIGRDDFSLLGLEWKRVRNQLFS